MAEIKKSYVLGRYIRPGMVIRFEYGDWGNWVNAHVKSVEDRAEDSEFITIYFDYGPKCEKLSKLNDAVLRKEGAYELIEMPVN